MMERLAVQAFLEGVDCYNYFLVRGFSEEEALWATKQARRILKVERQKLAMNKRYEVPSRNRKPRSFTFENLRVNIDDKQNRNYGMSKVTIYCVVEVWQSEDNDTIEKEYLVNFSDHKTKEWLVRLLVWGLMNKREIMLKPATKVDMDAMKMFVPRDKEKVE